MRILIIGLFFISALVSAQTLHTFSNGEVADADKVNQNFDHLTVMAQEAAHVGPGVGVDCEDDLSALNTAISDGYTNIRIISGICQISEQITNQSLTIIGNRGEDESLESGIKSSSQEIATYSADITLIDLKLLSPLITNGGNATLLRSTLSCDELTGDKDQPVLESYMTAVFAREASFEGCAGIALRAGATMNLKLSKIEPAAEKNALFIDQTSSLVSESNQFLPQSNTVQWHIQVNGDGIFRSDLIQGGVYANGARLTLQDIDFRDNGVGRLFLAAHFGSYLTIKESSFSGAYINTFQGGTVHLVHDPSEVHDDVEFAIDNGSLSFGGTFRGSNISATLTNLAYANLGKWEAGGAQVVNQSSIHLGHSSYLKAFATDGIDGYSVSCLDDLDLIEFSDGLSCTQPR